MAPSERETDLVEPEGVNAGGPVDNGPDPTVGDPPTPTGSGGGTGPEGGTGPDGGAEGQGAGELLSGPESHNGLTDRGPGQEMSAGEG